MLATSPNVSFFVLSLLNLNKELTRKAYCDGLTGTWNRLWMDENMDDLIQQSKKHSALLMVDIDHFKSINDRFGHIKGDEVLQSVATVLQENIRENDVCIRYGGEEFCIVLRNVSLRLAKQIGARLLKAVSQMKSPVECPVTISIGISITSIQGEVTRDLLTSADTALYQAKKSGRNQVCVAENHLEPQEKEPNAKHQHRTN